LHESYPLMLITKKKRKFVEIRPRKALMTKLTMPGIRVLLFICLFSFQYVDAQQNNIWYFGKKAGLDFGQTPPAPLHNSAMDTDEGSSNICDKNGNLLFYTNGVTVYNRNHQVMLNGNGLLGNISSVQSAIIIPHPGNINLYYIFTTDAIETDFAAGYNYSLVDITLDNGNGEVISKNTLLWASCTERLTAARHQNGTSVWLITNDRSSNIFRSWLIDCNGLNTTAVVSTVGFVLNGYDLMNTGMMKVSPDGKQLCQAHFPSFDDTNPVPNYVQLFDFDNATGSITNPRQVGFAGGQIISCEYSSNSRFLYLSRPFEQELDQLEATLPTAAYVISSRVIIKTVNTSYYGIQLAPDEKIYLAQPSTLLGVINSPNVKGAGCNFQKGQVDVNEGIGGSAYIGFPAYINDLSYDGSNRYDYSIMDSCTGTVQFNGFASVPGTITWVWDFGDGFTSTAQNPVHSFAVTAQRYTVTLIIRSTGGCQLFERTIKKKVVPKGVILTPAFDFTAVCSTGVAEFTNKSSFLPDTAKVQYYWDFDDGNTAADTNPVHTFSSGGIFNVRLTIKTTKACLDQSITHPVDLKVLNIQVSPGSEIDAGETVQLNVTGGGTNFKWTPNTGLSNPAIANPVAKPLRNTMYVVTAFNEAGCQDTDSVYIKVRQVPGIYVPTAFTPNNDGKNDIFKPFLSDEFDLLEFSIYNRWGQKIFMTAQKEVGWNGKLNGLVQDTGVYVWIVNGVDTRSGKRVAKKGTFVIIR